VKGAPLTKCVAADACCADERWYLDEAMMMIRGRGLLARKKKGRWRLVDKKANRRGMEAPNSQNRKVESQRGC